VKNEKTIHQRKIILKNILLTAGVIEILVGCLHFLMPYFLYQSNGFEQLNSIESDYLLLITYAVGILLVAFGATTLLFAIKIDEFKKILFYYLLIKIILWTARVILEILYPLGLSMFYIEPFTTIVLPGLVLELFLFIVSIILVRHYKAEKA